MRNGKLFWGCVAAVGVAVFALVWFVGQQRGGDRGEGAGGSDLISRLGDPTKTREELEAEATKEQVAAKQFVPVDNRQTLADALGVPLEEIVSTGGVDRPRRDVEDSNVAARVREAAAAEDAGGASEASDPAEPVSVESVLPKYANVGASVPLMGNENAQVAGLMAELQQGEGDEVTLDAEGKAARSVYFAPEPFDRQAYQANPQEYLDKIRPARAFHPAQPGPEVKPIKSETRTFQQVLQGERVVLRIKADPGVPVAFYTPQVGRFDNLLSSYTVAANDEGVATATWHAGPGSWGINDIVVASPEHSGQLQFRVDVSVPDGPQGAGG